MFTTALLIVLLIAGLFLPVVLLPVIFTRTVVNRHCEPKDQDQSSPDVVSEPLSTDDGISVASYLIPCDLGACGTIILCGPFGSTHEFMVSRAQFANALGYDALLFDYRNTGQSGDATGSLGYWERLDVLAAVRHARERQRRKPIILWGVSMGATSALLAADGNLEVSAIIAESPFVALLDVIAVHLWVRFHLPAYPIAHLTAFWIAQRAGFRTQEFDLRRCTPSLDHCRLLLLTGCGDRCSKPQSLEVFGRLLRATSLTIVSVHSSKHGFAFQEASEEYQQLITKFLADSQNQTFAEGTPHSRAVG